MITLETQTREKLKNALLNTAENTDAADSPYEVIELTSHFIEEEFDEEVFKVI